MTNHDLLDAMQSLDAKYTAEADARAEEAMASRKRSRIRLMPALVTLGSAAACFAVLFGVAKIGRSDRAFQTASSEFSEVALQEETRPQVSTTETTAPVYEAASEATEVTTVTAATTGKASVQTTAGTTSQSESAPKTTAAQTPTGTAAAVTAPTRSQTQTSSTQRQRSSTAATRTTATEQQETTAQPVQPQNEEPQAQLICEQVTAHAGDTVPVRIIAQHAVFPGSFGALMQYDTALVPETEIRTVLVEASDLDPDWWDTHPQDEDPPLVEVEKEFLVYTPGCLAYAPYTTSLGSGAFSFGGMIPWSDAEDRPETLENAELITVYFKVPEDAVRGTVYSLDLTVASWYDMSVNPCTVTGVAGSITVE